MLYPIYPQPYGSVFSVDVNCEFSRSQVFIQPSESFDSPINLVPAKGAPLSVLIRAGTPYSLIAASQIARTWLRSMRETIWQ
jgi:hypothetical protein